MSGGGPPASAAVTTPRSSSRLALPALVVESPAGTRAEIALSPKYPIVAVSAGTTKLVDAGRLTSAVLLPTALFR